MTWLRLALANLTLSPLTTLVNVLLMGLGTASIVLLLLAGVQLTETMSRDAKGVDLVLGAQGSPVQLILSAVYHADVPPGNIKLADAERWADDSRVSAAVPVSLGDSFRGFRIVGTTHQYAELYNADLASGKMWDESMEAVVGAAIAESGALALGSTFAGAHGLVEGGHSHDEQLYSVVGVLAPTGSVVDRLVLTSLESVWELHGQEAHAHEDHEDDHEGEHDAHEDEHDAHEDDHENKHDAHEEEHEGHEEHDAHEHEAHEDEHESHADEHADHEDGHEDEHEAHEDEHEPHEDEHEGHEDEHVGHEDEHGDDEEHRDHEHAEDADEHDHDSDVAYREDIEVTAMLMSYATPMAATTLPLEINAEGSLQAAAPAMEIARILQLVGVGMTALGAFAWVLVVTAALSIFAALYGSLRARRGELAMLRCLGATRYELLIYLIVEGFLMTIFGVSLGVIVGHIVMELVGLWLADTRGISMTGWTWVADEALLIIGLFCVGVVSAIIPAIQAYRTDVATALVEG